MGFDINVCLNVWIDETTGLPFVYGKGHEKLPYVSGTYIVPEKHRKYLKQRGGIFHFYIKGIEGYTTDVGTFLHHYPDWRQVKKDIGADGETDYGWTKADHDGFKQALKWLDSKQVFGITWSY
jgi:hypothetical protein